MSIARKPGPSAPRSKRCDCTRKVTIPASPGWVRSGACNSRPPPASRPAVPGARTIACERSWTTRAETRRERIILASCEKGAAQDDKELRRTLDGPRSVKEANPDLVELAARMVTLPQRPELVAAPPDPFYLHRWTDQSQPLAGWPRRCTDRYRARLQSVPRMDRSSPRTWRVSGSRLETSCGPARLLRGSIARARNAVRSTRVTRRRWPSRTCTTSSTSTIAGTPLHAIFLPQFDILESSLAHCAGSHACPTAAATPLAVGAAFRSDVDVFAAERIAYLHPLLNFTSFPCSNGRCTTAGIRCSA